MSAQLAALIPYVIVGLFALSCLLFVFAFQQLRRGRTGPYWRLRREAGQRGGQLFLLALTLFGVALALAFFSGLAAVAIGGVNRFFNPRDPDELFGVALASSTPTLAFSPTATVRPTFTPVPTDTIAPSLTPSPTPSPTLTATATPTRTPLPTLTPSITPTPTSTFEVALNLTPPLTARPPHDDAALRLVAVGAALSADTPTREPNPVLPAGTRRIYLYFDYRQMDVGVAWTRVLYREGVAVQGGTLLWSMDTQGSSSFFFGSADGYPPGDYEVRLSLNGQEVSRLAFTISTP